MMIAFTKKCGETALYIILCGMIALLSCFIARSIVAEFIGSLFVFIMFTLYFTMTAREFSAQNPEKRGVIFCVCDGIVLVLKITFVALCAQNGGVMIHAAAFIADIVFSKICMVKALK